MALRLGALEPVGNDAGDHVGLLRLAARGAHERGLGLTPELGELVVRRLVLAVVRAVVAERRLDVARLHRQHAHAVVAELEARRLGDGLERELRRRIEAGQGRGHYARHRRDVHDRAAPPARATPASRPASCAPRRTRWSRTCGALRRAALSRPDRRYRTPRCSRWRRARPRPQARRRPSRRGRRRAPGDRPRRDRRASRAGAQSPPRCAPSRPTRRPRPGRSPSSIR